MSQHLQPYNGYAAADYTGYAAPDAARQVVSIKIRRLILQEMAGYSPLYLRPYSTHVDSSTLNNITQRVESLGGKRITGADLSGAAVNIISPTATPGSEIQIPNGWETPRVRFVLEVECGYNTGAIIIFYFQGFTDYPGISTSNLIAPDMHFFINSMTGVARLSQMTPSGVVYNDRIYESVHYLTNFEYSGDAVRGNQKYTMRPYDLMTGMEGLHINNAYYGESCVDTRNVMKHDPMQSNRANGNSTAYLANIIDAYSASIQQADFGFNEQNLYSMTQTELREDLPSQNPFISRISQMNNGALATNCFTYGMLQAIDPNVVHVLNHIIQAPTQQAAPTALNAEYWNGSTRETVIATRLAQVVPALMLELLITKLWFSSTNDDIGGRMTTQLGSVMSLTSADLSRHCEIFKRRLENEVLFDVTYGNEDTYSLNMQVDIFGETWTRLSINGGSTVDFVTPTFCDNLLSPVITNNYDHFATVTGDVEQIIRHCGDATNNLPLREIGHRTLFNGVDPINQVETL